MCCTEWITLVCYDVDVLCGVDYIGVLYGVN